MYFDFEAGNQQYKLRLNTRNIIALEEKLGGKNPLSIFGNGDRLPSIKEMVAILWASLQQYHHGITLNDTENIFDAYLEEHIPTDFIATIVEIYKVSGLIKEEDSEKN